VLQDSEVEGVLKADQIQALMDGDHAAFASRALALHDAGVAALKAIDERNVPALSEVGGVIDEACEQCHTKYWYPTAPAAPSAVPRTPRRSRNAIRQRRPCTGLPLLPQRQRPQAPRFRVKPLSRLQPAG
jgi:hypothetical protein